MQSSLISESIFAPLPGSVQLHMRRIRRADTEPGPPVFCLHGSIENGRIFYSESGKGFAPYLASQGFDVFVPDLRGRGKSTPAVNADSDHGQAEAISEEIPAFLDQIISLRGETPIHFVSHSWGGINLLCWLARPHRKIKVDSMVFFGTKRRISVRNLTWIWAIWFAWNRLAPRIIRKKGFLDAISSKMGSDNISAGTFRETQAWVQSKDWMHWQDGFDYRMSLNKMALPPTLYFAGKKDRVLGHPTDVKNLIQELGKGQQHQFHLLSRKNGNLHDYGHIDMLTQKDAVKDHFPQAVEWMRRFETKNH